MAALSIGRRLMIAASLVVFLTLSGFILYFDIQERHDILDALRAQVSEIGELATTDIAHWVSGRELLIRNLAQIIATEGSEDQAEALVKLPVLSDTFLFTYYGTAGGRMIMHPPGELPADYDPRQRPWYQDATRSGRSTLTEPYEDASTGDLIVTVTTPVLVQGRALGVVGGDLTIATIGDVVRSVDLDGKGYAFLVNRDGTIIIHPDPDLTLKNLSEAFPDDLPQVGSGIDDLGTREGARMFAFFKVEGLPTVEWYLGFAIDREAAFASLAEFRVTGAVTTLIAIVAIIGLLGILVGRWVSRPILSMSRVMSRLADGDLTAEIPGLERKDEMGSMAAAVMVFKENAVEKQKLAKEQGEAERRIAEERKNALWRMADTFEQSVLSIVESVAGSADNTQRVAQELTESAAETTSRAGTVASAAEETSSNVATVAAAAEELSAAIREISAQLQQSMRVAGDATTSVETTSKTVGDLADAAQRIGEVVNLIKSVAGQTNLLALNATIEAARAGEAGKGFAVVAQEVKSLANQTDKATGDIQAQVEGIQAASAKSVENTAAIDKIIEKISEYTNAIAAAVEQQGAATGEIARNVQRASEGTRMVSSNVSAVTSASAMVSEEAKRLLGLSSELQSSAEQLRTEVLSFLETVRSG